MSETVLMEQIRARIVNLGLTAYHAHDARRSWGPGFPDLVIVGSRVLWRECKTEAGVLRPEQRQWGHKLRAAGQSWAVWRPRDLFSGAIDQQLAEIAPAPQLSFALYLNICRAGIIE